jgi:hypothetical protein
MYLTILHLHSFLRWLVLICLSFALCRSYNGWFSNRHFSSFDNWVRHITATIAHLQLILGITLYCISPLVRYFYSNYIAAIHQREIRFFGIEHSSIMLGAIVLITIGSAKAKRRKSDKDKFRTMAVWYTIALLVILISIPWPFSPMASRPLFRHLAR